MAASDPEPSRHIEVARKFDVLDTTVSPSFDGISAVTRVQESPPQSLDSVYFDTPGQDLAYKQVTLRRRNGGSDAGWHLKLPAGFDARTEMHAPLHTPEGGGDDTVPAELLEVVLAIVRDRPLAPVARISTIRDVRVLLGADGVTQAEFCSDEVTAWAAHASSDQDGAAVGEQHWREWELKLADGSADNTALLDQLTNRLLDAGAVRAGHSSKLARVLNTARDGAGERRPRPEDPARRAVAEQVDQLLAWDRGVRADTDDAVHQMRVTTRKIRSLLATWDESFGHAGEWIGDELRQLASVLGVSRDAEVLAARYRRALDELPPELVRGRVRERLVDGATRRYQIGLRRSLVAMRLPRYFRLLDALDALVAERPPADDARGQRAPATFKAPYARVRKAAKAAARLGSDATDDDRDQALHRIRKGAKRLRYAAAATGKDKVAERAKTIQAVLGEHQDSVVSRTHLGQQADAAHAAGEDTFTYGLLYQREDDEGRSCRAQLDAALRKLEKAMRNER